MYGSMIKRGAAKFGRIREDAYDRIVALAEQNQTTITAQLAVLLDDAIPRAERKLKPKGGDAANTQQTQG
jgi:hypothetical protein